MSQTRPIKLPRVSDYVVEPESGTELFQGERREALPAGPLHSRQHVRVTVVVNAYAAPGYGADLDLLTRQSEDDNFASDACIRKDGRDPETDDRYLEELVFEVKSAQSEKDLRQRAQIMARRGVRRVFAIPVRGSASGDRVEAGPVREWDATRETWRELGVDDVIEDRCLYRPLPVRALLEAMEAERAVAQAYLDKHIDVIEEYAGERYRAGKTEAVRDSLFLLLEARSIALDAAVRQRVAACSDVVTLQRWLTRAATASAAHEIFAGDPAR